MSWGIAAVVVLLFGLGVMFTVRRGNAKRARIEAASPAALHEMAESAARHEAWTEVAWIYQRQATLTHEPEQIADIWAALATLYLERFMNLPEAVSAMRRARAADPDHPRVAAALLDVAREAVRRRTDRALFALLTAEEWEAARSIALARASTETEQALKGELEATVALLDDVSRRLPKRV